MEKAERHLEICRELNTIYKAKNKAKNKGCVING